MPKKQPPRSSIPEAKSYLPILILLFVGSGCATLVYEVVWLQLLQLVIGSSAVSLGVLLGTFMGGMCLGSFLLPRLVDPRYHPLRVYAYLELGIGACGLLVLFGVPLIGGVYKLGAGWGLTGPFVRALVAGVCLLPLLYVTGTFQKRDHVGFRDRFVDSQLFRRRVDAGSSRVNFARQQVVDTSRENSPVIDQDPQYNRADENDRNDDRRTEQPAHQSPKKARTRLHVRHYAWLARITITCSGILIFWWITYWHK